MRPDIRVRPFWQRVIRLPRYIRTCLRAGMTLSKAFSLAYGVLTYRKGISR